MNSGNLKILAGATIVLVGVLAVSQYDGGDSDRVDELLFPALREQINEATTISVTRAGEHGEVVIRKTADTWVNASRNDYPADVGKIRQLLLQLSEAKLTEQKTANAEHYGQLGVQDPAEEGSKGTRLKISGEALSFDVVLGNVAQPGYRYARKFDETQSWLIDEDPTIPANAADWLVKDLVDIKADAIRSVTIRHPDGEEIRIGKESAEQTDFDVADIPAGRELSYATVANSIAGALNALTFDDVRAGDALAGDTVSTTFETFDGDRIEVLATGEEDGDWISIRAASADSESEAAAAINDRTQGWQFRIAGYKADQLSRRWDDILQALPEPDTEEE
jgi:hypothetical protein